MRSKALEAHFTGIYLAQCARGERFHSAADIVEAIPTLTDVVNLRSEPIKAAQADRSAPINNVEFVEAFGVEKPREATVRKVTTKYRNVVTDGYASRKEGRRAHELAMLQRAGEITELTEQPEFLLIPKQDGERPCTYTADFSYTTRAGKYVVEDVKGLKTQQYVIRRKLMLFLHGIKITEV